MPLAGPIGHGKYPVDALAVSVTNTDLAVTTNRRTTLRRAPIATGKPPARCSAAVTDLLRPQFTRYGEIWDIGREGGRQRMWMFTAGNKKPSTSTHRCCQKVTAFKISPDGTRMALVRRTTNRVRARAGQNHPVATRSWSTAGDPWTPPKPACRQSAGSPTSHGSMPLSCWCLGAADADNAYAPFRVVEDASRITPKGESENWDAVELAVLPRTQTAIIVGRDGQTWKDDGSQWLPFVDKISTIAYPG